MHVISRSRLRAFCQTHADACAALDDWYTIANQATWQNLIEVQQIYPQAEAVEMPPITSDTLSSDALSAERYGDLLAQYQPRLIKTAAENEAFLKIVAELMHRPNLTPEENTLLDLLVKLLEDFEADHYPLNVSTPRSRLLHLMDARNLDLTDLTPVLGDRAAPILTGNAEISLTDALALAPYFHVKPELFLT